MNKIKYGMLLAILPATMGMATFPQLAQLAPAKQADVVCLAKNIYHEARGEPIEGQIAVAQVTVNRVNSGEFQSNICKTVYANKQFSWTEKPAKVKDRKAWEASVIIATAVLTKSIHLPDFKALYFHTRQIRPKWSRTKQVVAKIGNHIFYA